MSDNNELLKENEELRAWIDDLQSGMYVNCVYCGHRYGPNKNTPVSMADVLKKHIEHCPKHPMYSLKMRNMKLRIALAGLLSVIYRSESIEPIGPTADEWGNAVERAQKVFEENDESK